MNVLRHVLHSPGRTEHRNSVFRQHVACNIFVQHSDVFHSMSMSDNRVTSCEIGRCLQPGSWPQTLAQPLAGMQADEEARLEGEEVVRFWTRERDLAAVVFYVRKTGPASIEYLVLPQLYASGTDRTWEAGTCRPDATNAILFILACMQLQLHSETAHVFRKRTFAFRERHSELDMTGANWVQARS